MAAGATLQASEGEQLLQCVSSIMARTRQGDDKRASTDRLMYSHRNRFEHGWAADFLLSHQHRIKYFQMPKSGYKAIRAKMSEHFKAPAAYTGLGLGFRGTIKHLPGGTPMKTASSPVAMQGEVRVRARASPAVERHCRCESSDLYHIRLAAGCVLAAGGRLLHVHLRG